MRLPSLVLAAVLLFGTVLAPAAGAAEADCPFQHKPAKAIDASEDLKPGNPAPTPLPVPNPPVGGAQMGTCGIAKPAGASNPPKDVTVSSWLVADMDTGAVLAAHNPHARLRPASLIKTLLALVVVRELDMGKKVVGTQQDADQEGTRVGLGPGGKYTVGLLLKVLLMRSGNDAAHALAMQLGGVDQAVAKMNATAKELGALDTRAATPSGLDAPGMCTSAYDLALIFRAAMKDPRIAEAVATKHVQFPGYADKPGFQVNNDNKLLGVYPGFLGGKTGFTDDARHTYLGGASRGGHRVEVVLMHGEQHPVRMADQGAHLFDYGFGLLGKPPVGQLVEEQVTPAQPNQPGGAQGSGVRATTSPGSASSSSMASVVLPVLIAVVLVAVVGLLLWRRRKPSLVSPSLVTTSPATAVPPPDESEQTRPIG
ncbi:D-alanyl-D-alanine carboxypeptidase family protein [Labedaea rhizosphaerae]|uniref:D-alanyl-D-alanine carboxypeptidase (Penicillin-binding protein 5/6) n=1 Tax=Labedaea rhizosphaerae TaxID=598644 RepID=A0A4R6SQN1_LABRH|nr:D-alanyl-D-alanine carboxypeptidase family protein [Labedaea rhizosphaerae]TDQ05930.1 D-alanyl-D-alanine carboxypeptidase (penicillin-binding protein 5/6) [Labedaea rhizosphaerae]